MLSAVSAGGPEFQVNATGAGTQVGPDVATDGNGNYVVAWTSDGVQPGVYVQRIDAAGQRVGGEIRAYAASPAGLGHPSVGIDADGDVVVAWTSSAGEDGSGSAVGARRYDAQGQPVGEPFRVNTTTLYDQHTPDVSMDDAGNFVIAWQGYVDGSPDVFAQRYRSDGTPIGGEFRVNTTAAGAQEAPAVEVLPDGSFIIAWDGDGPDPDRDSIYAQRFDAAGNGVGGESRVNTHVNGDQRWASLDSDPAGNLLVAWSSMSQDGSNWGIYYQKYDPAGTPAGAEMRANAITQSAQLYPSVAAFADGEFIVAWQGQRSSGAYDIVARRIDGSGVPAGGDLPVNTLAGSGMNVPAVAVSPSGTTMLVWQGHPDGQGNGIGGRFFTPVSGAASVGGRVWNDAAANGVFDLQESGQDGVSVRLLDEEGALVGSILTSGGGNYLFDNLVPGVEYVLEFVPSSGRVLTARQVGNDRAVDSDPDPLTRRTDPIRLGPDERDLTYGAGLVSPGSISGTVFRDGDDSGTLTAGEPGLAGWVVFIDQDGNGTRDAAEPSVVTSTSGAYSFGGLVTGTYVVVLEQQDRWTQTTDPATLTVSLPPGVSNRDVNVGVLTAPPRGAIGPVGPEVLLDVETDKFDRLPAVAAAAPDGGYVVAWAAPDSSGSGIHVQRFDAAGVAAGTTLRANTNVSGGEWSPSVAMDVAGNAVVVWWSPTQSGIYARRYSAAGAALGDPFRVNTRAVGTQNDPSVAMDAAGNFFVVYRDSSADGWGSSVLGQRFSAAGAPVGGEFLVNTFTQGDQQNPSVSMDAAGNAVVVWTSTGQDGGGTGTYAQRYDAAGAPVGQEFRVNTLTSGSQDAAGVAHGPDGGFVVAFTGSGHGGTGAHLRRYDAEGAPQGESVLAAPAGSSAALDVGAGGEILLAWHAGTSGAQDVYARVFDAAGQSVGNVLRVNTSAAGAQRLPAVAIGRDGAAVIAWQGAVGGANLGVYAQRYAGVGDEPGSVGDYAWSDTDGDGAQDGFELGQAGVAVELYNEAGAIVAETLTVAGGAYRFDWLRPGQYHVRFAPPASLVLTDADRGGDDASDSDADIVTGRTPSFTVGAGEFVSSIDAGVVAPGSISGLVFLDEDRDGARDTGEPALAGWIVYDDRDGDALADADEASGITAADGTYTLAKLNPGVHRVRLLPQPRWTPTSAADRNVTVPSGRDVPGVNFGVVTDVAESGSAPRGREFQVNTNGQSNQLTSAAGRDRDGNFVVVWQSWGQDGSSGGIYGQRYTPDGAPRGGEFQINASAGGDQASPAVAMRGDGAFVVAWASENDGDGYGIFARRFDASGAPLGGEFQVNSYTSDHQTAPSVGIDAGGNFVIAWTSRRQDGGGMGVYARRFAADGSPLGDEFRVNVRTELDQSSPRVAMGSGGEFAIVYSDDRGTVAEGFDVMARRFDAAGIPAGQEFRVNTYSSGEQVAGGVGVDDDGNWIVSWSSMGQDGSERGIYAQRFDARGVRQGAEFRVNTVTQGEQRDPSVGVGADGDFVIAWSSLDGSGWGVFGQRYDAAGLARGSQFHANEQTALDQYDSAVSVLPNGFVVAWASTDQDGSGAAIMARSYETFVAPGAVGDRVWLDADTDGIQDESEAGQAGVVVRLVRVADGLLIDSTQTAADGSYRFAAVKPGVSYYVEFAAPFGRAFTRRDRGADDAADSDASLGGRSHVFSVSVGQRELGVDAGLVPAATSRGVVFIDRNGNGTRDAGEEGMSGWVLFIDEDGDGTRDAGEFGAVSGQDGVYSFAPLGPGSFRLVQSPQDRWTRTTPDEAMTIVVTAGQTDVVGPDVGNHTTVPDFAPGAEGPTVSVSTGSVESTDVATFDDGSYVVAWQDHDAKGVFVQRFHAGGQPAWAKTRVSLNSGVHPTVAADGVGNGFVVVWEGTEPGNVSGVFARRYTATGEPIGDAFPVTVSVTTWKNPDVAMNASGEFIVAWGERDTAGMGVYARAFDAAGAPRGVGRRVNTTIPGDQSMPAPAIDDAGNAFVAWYSEGADLAVTGVYGRSLAPDGSPVGPEALIAANGSEPSASMNGRGELAVAWVGTFGIMALRFDGAGAAQGAPSQADTSSNGMKGSPVTSMADDGSFVVVWQDRTDPVERHGDYGRLFNAAGLPHGAEFRINAADRDPRYEPAVAMTAGGDFVVAWSVWDDAIFAQRFERFEAAASVGDLVWDDVDGDGVQDAAEPGIDGVTVRLFTEEGLPRGSTVTAGGGAFRFDDLRPGRGYYLEFVAPAGYVVTAPLAGADRVRDSDARDGGKTGVFVAGPSATRGDVDGGMVRRATISGTKYHDRNANGVRDEGEEGLGGWTVFIDADADGQLDAAERRTETGPGGAFSFTDLRPGAYRVAEVPQQHWTLTTAAAQLVATVGPAELRTGVNVGNYTPIATTVPVPLGPAEPVSTNRPAYEQSPIVAADAAGNYVVVWQNESGGDGQDIFAQRYDATGNRLGIPFRVNETATGAQSRPGLAMNRDGEFVVVWQHYVPPTSSYPVVRAQRFSADGSRNGAEFEVSPPTTRESHMNPGVALDEDGDFVVEWHRTIFGDAGARTYNVYAQRYNRAGEKRGADFFVASLPSNGSGDKVSDIAMDDDGDFVITWHQGGNSGDGHNFGVFARRYDAAGAPLGEPFVVNTLTQYNQYQPTVAMDGDGDFVIGWADDDSNRRLLYAQRFASDGTRQGGQFLVGPAADNAKVVMSRDTDEILFTWIGAGSAYARRYSAAGLPQGESQVLGRHNDRQGFRTSGTFVPGGFVTAWTEYVNEANKWDAMVRRYADVVTSPLATGGDDAFYVRLNAAGDAVEIHRGAGPQQAPAHVLPRSLLPSLHFNGLGGNDTVVIDLVNGDPMPPGGISFDGGDGFDALLVTGTGGDDRVTIGGGNASAADAVGVTRTELVEFAGNGGTDDLSVIGATVSLAGGNHEFGTLRIGTGATVALSGAGGTLRVNDLDVDAAAARLDLAGSVLIAVNGDPAAIEALVGSARNGGQSGRWTGYGITTSAPVGSIRSLAVMRTDTGSTVRLTYNGDANGDGRINADDYFRIDQGFLAQPTNPLYAQGDFNYDGRVNADDYFLIDQAFLGQGAPLAGDVPVASTAAASVVAAFVSEKPQEKLLRKRAVRPLFSDEPVLARRATRRTSAARMR